MAVVKPTHGALPPPTGLECEQEIRQETNKKKEKKTTKQTNNNNNKKNLD